MRQPFSRIRSQRGIAALLTTIFVAVFISILTISLADVLNTEQQQTLDVHNSDRAEQAAQAGVEDALARIKYWSDTNGCVYTETESSPTSCTSSPLGDNNNGSNNCPSSISGSNNFWEFTENSGNACWVHRNITSNANNLSGSLVADTGNYTSPSTAEINLTSPTQTAKALVVNWGDPSTNPISTCSFNQGTNSTNWPSNTAGALEVTVVSFDSSGNIANPIKGVLMPKETLGIPCNSATYAPDLGTFSQCPSQYDQSTGANPAYQFCTQITLPPSQTGTYPDAYLRLRARFAGDTYSVTALNATGGTVISDLPSNSLTIDVTGQSGSAYRRIIAQSTITNPQLYSIFDFVLFSQDDLNKSYSCINAAPNATCQ